MLLQNRGHLLDSSQRCVDSIWNLEGMHEVEKLSVLARIKVTEQDAKHCLDTTVGVWCMVSAPALSALPLTLTLTLTRTLIFILLRSLPPFSRWVWVRVYDWTARG
jgi:hypothetical protein